MTALTLADFLRARLDEDEAVAQLDLANAMAGTMYGVPSWGAAPASVYYAAQSASIKHAQRVLADVEAKRRIVANMQTLSSQAWQDGDAAPVMEACSTRVLRHLASVYADHPDYDERWRV